MPENVIVNVVIVVVVVDDDFVFIYCVVGIVVVGATRGKKRSIDVFLCWRRGVTPARGGTATTGPHGQRVSESE